MIKFTESMLSKMKKKELVELILQMQEECNGSSKTLYETTGDKDRKIVFNVSIPGGGAIRYFYILKPGDLLEVATEKITPSGYPESGTYVVNFRVPIRELLGDKEYKRLKKIGWNMVGLKQVVFPALEKEEEK